MSRWSIKPLLDAAHLRTTRVSAFTGARSYVSTGYIDGSAIVRSESVTFDDRPSRADLSAKRGDVLFARISVKDITTGKLRFEDCKYVSLTDHQRYTKRCQPDHLDILYTKVGATYGRAALVDTQREFSIYVSVCLIKPDRGKVDPQFLNAAMNTDAVKRQADQRIKGIGVPDLHLDQIKEFLIPLPPLELQREFAGSVAQVQVLEAAQTASRQRLDDLFQSLLHRAFQGEL